jgi:formate dehydrogenase major subunit
MTRRTSNELILKDDYLMINPTDADENLISEGDYVCIESPRGKVDVKAKITEDVKSGILSTTFHFPEIMINNLTGDVHDSEAMCPEYKVVAVRIRKSKGKHKKSLV